MIFCKTVINTVLALAYNIWSKGFIRQTLHTQFLCHEEHKDSPMKVFPSDAISLCTIRTMHSVKNSVSYAKTGGKEAIIVLWNVKDSDDKT